MPDLSRLLTPRSVVIVGASPTPGALGGAVLRNLDRHGYAGAIHLVNPQRDEIAGRPCLRVIDDLPPGVDAAVLAIPADGVLPAVRALGRRGVGAAIIFAAGFAESGEEGSAAQAAVARAAADGGLVIEGPNCLGFVNHAAGVPLTFVDMPVIDLSDRPAVAIVSQSGAMAVVLGTTLVAKGLGITLSVSTGNEAGSGVEDYLEHLLADPTTPAIGLIVERFRDPARFLALARRARVAGRRIVLLHPGTSRAARESAATHTGAMAGDWHVMRTMVERVGVVLVDGLEALGDVLDLVVRARPVRAGGVAVLTESGAFKALTLDMGEAIGLPLPPLGQDTAAALRTALPDFIPLSNPMDLTAQTLVAPDLFRRTMVPLLADDAYAALVLGIIQTDKGTAVRKFPAIIDAVAQLAPDKAVIFAGLDDGAPVPAAYVDALRALHVPYFPSPERALRALRHLIGAAARDERRSEVAPVTLDLPSGIVPEYRAKQLLAAAGIPFPAGGFAASPAEARSIAARIGYPVAIKAQAAALVRKSEAGGVLLDIADETALDAGWARLHANVAVHDPTVALDGVQVEAMGRRGVELIVGGRNDPDWGPVILVGFGGVTAELLGDVRLLPHDLTHDAIIAELRRSKQSRLLDGYRGSPALDVDAVARLVTTLARVLAGTPLIREVDLNPVVVYPAGEGAVALDALILTK